MSEYNKYVEAVNKIFELVAKMRVNYPDQDNLALLESIEENKQIVITNAKLFNKQSQKNQTQPSNQAAQVPVSEKKEA